jgi:hypothetical protein
LNVAFYNILGDSLKTAGIKRIPVHRPYSDIALQADDVEGGGWFQKTQTFSIRELFFV